MLLFCLFCGGCLAADLNPYSADRDVRSLAQTGLVSFEGQGIFGIPGSLASEEILIRRIVRKEDAVKYFIEVYNTGTPAAKVYALAYFHHSVPELFEICWKDNIGGYNPVVASRAGCLTMEGSLTEHLFRIKLGEYDRYIESAIKRTPFWKAKMSSSGPGLQ